MLRDGTDPEDGPVPKEAQEVLDLVADLARRIKERKRREQQERDKGPEGQQQ